MIPTPTARIGPGVIRRTPKGPVVGVWCRCPVCETTNFVALGDQRAHMSHNGISLSPGFVCGCKLHLGLEDGQWVVCP